MKIYLMTDLEGISGVSNAEYMEQDSPFYQEARRYLMGDVNAAIAGCFDAGVDEVVVKDGHFKGLNFIMDQLDERVVQDYGHRRWTGMLNGSFDGTMIIGQHAMAGTLDGFLDHTMSSRSWWEYLINGRPHGELGMWAAIAGHFDVPLIFVCGDERAGREAGQFVEGVTTVAVKEGRGRNKAVCKPVKQAQSEIRQGVRQAVDNIERVKPYKIEVPATVQLTYCRSDMADGAAAGEGIERVDARTVRKVVETALDVLL